MNEGVWLTEQAGGIGSAFHLPLAISFDGDLDVAALLAACRALVERHPVLATSVDQDDGVPRVVRAPNEVPISMEQATDEDIERRIQQETVQPFDLRRGPLARFTLYQLAPRRFVLLFVAHHLVFDGQSKDILVRDLSTLYSGSRLDPLPPVESEPPGDATEFWRVHRHSAADVVLPGATRSTGGAGAAHEFTVQVETPPGVTRFEFLFGALQVLLRRYGNRDMAVAIELGTRTEHTREHIGHFVNELPVVSSPDLESSFRQHVTRLRAQLRELYQVRAVPLASAVTGLRPAASLASVSLSYRKRTVAPEFPGLHTEVRWMMFNHASRNALHVQVVDSPDSTLVSFQYNPASMTADNVRRIASQFTAVINTAVANPDTLLRDFLPGNTAPIAVDAPVGTIHGLVEAQVAVTPDAIAITGDDAELSYVELDGRANAVAERLRAHGVGRGTLVAIQAERSLELVVGLLGILKTGAAYLPLDPAYPADRTEFVLSDSGAEVIEMRLADASHASAGPQPAEPTDLAYVIYTSGSTGRPKGVQVEHRSVVNLLLAMAELLGSGPDDVWLGVTTPSFDISVLEMFLPLVTGGRLVLPAKLAITPGITHVQATPSGWELLLEENPDLSSVTALCGGEALPLPLARRLRAQVKRLWNMYGPTETTIWSMADEVGAEVTLGGPIANTRLYVLDEQAEPVPPGVAGELFIAGAGLARGYLNRPELTAERFPPDPFAPGRMYRTGDRVRERPDGRLEFLGRTDSQVKVRGHRVELGEVESVMLTHPAVRQAAVVLREDRLIGYVIGDAAGMAEHLAKSLPGYMLPTIVSVDEFPLTPNGKLDRKALPEPPRGPRPVAGQDSEIAAIVREVLRIEDEIDPDESLFELGVTSLTIMRIAARIRRRLRADLPLHRFYDTPTVAGIASAVAATRG